MTASERSMVTTDDDGPRMGHPPKLGHPLKMDDPPKFGDPPKLDDPAKLEDDPPKMGHPLKFGSPLPPKKRYLLQVSVFLANHFILILDPSSSSKH